VALEKLLLLLLESHWKQRGGGGEIEMSSSSVMHIEKLV
jgi:hypothetical protein